MTAANSNTVANMTSIREIPRRAALIGRVDVDLFIEHRILCITHPRNPVPSDPLAELAGRTASQDPLPPALRAEWMFQRTDRGCAGQSAQPDGDSISVRPLQDKFGILRAPRRVKKNRRGKCLVGLLAVDQRLDFLGLLPLILEHFRQGGSGR